MRRSARGGPWCGPCEAVTRGDGPRWGILRASMTLQKRPQTSLELQLSTNTIFPSLKPSHLTPWTFPNSPTYTLGDSVHGGAASGGTERLRQPPGTYVDPPYGLITISDPSGYTK